MKDICIVACSALHQSIREVQYSRGNCENKPGVRRYDSNHPGRYEIGGVSSLAIEKEMVVKKETHDETIWGVNSRCDFSCLSGR